jgi:hypothetical protein
MAKFKVLLEVARGVCDSYKVLETVNTIHPLPGEFLKVRDVEELISRARNRSGTVTIREAKKRS